MRFINLLLGVIAALLAATAMGAIWSLFGLAGSGRASWMAVPSALALAAVLRFNNHPPGVVRAVLCLCLLALTPWNSHAPAALVSPLATKITAIIALS